MAKYAFLAFLCFLMFVSNSQSTDELDSYLNLKFSTFYQWADSHNLDPSPRTAGPTPFTASNTHSRSDYILRNHGIEGHSRSDHKLLTKETDINSYLKLTFMTRGNVTFGGDYSSNGTVWDKEISTQGTWYMTVPGTWFWNVSVEFTNTTLGYINIDSYSQIVLDVYPDEHEVYFEHLWEDAGLETFEKVIKDAVFQRFRTLLKVADLQHPIAEIYQKYFMEILTEETWDNIVGTPTTKVENEMADHN